MRFALVPKRTEQSSVSDTRAPASIVLSRISCEFFAGVCGCAADTWTYRIQGGDFSKLNDLGGLKKSIYAE